jgi:CMP-N-acetylneuraminic acid synthetase
MAKQCAIPKPVCIIPARGGSKRFPRKNLAFLAGKPLLAYAIAAALESQVFETVCVSSEDEEILETAKKYGAHLALPRPLDLASDSTQVKQLCLYLLDHFTSQGLDYQEFGLLLVTSPLRQGVDIREAYNIFKNSQANYVMSLVPWDHPPQRAVWTPNGYVEPYFGPQYMQRTQVLDTLYRHDGSIIFARTGVFQQEKDFFGSKIVPYFIPPERSVDIDNPLDLEWAEFLLSRSQRASEPPR